MKYDKSFLRKKFLLKRKKNFLLAKKFNFNLLFSIINKHFLKKKVVIAGYYPSNYEVNILEFLEKALKKILRSLCLLLNLHRVCVLNHGLIKSHSL